MQMLIAERFKYIVLYGKPMRYRRARISSYHFETQSIPKTIRTNEIAFAVSDASGSAGRAQ